MAYTLHPTPHTLLSKACTQVKTALTWGWMQTVYLWES